MAAPSPHRPIPTRRRRRRLNKKKVTVMAVCALALLTLLIWGLFSLFRALFPAEAPDSGGESSQDSSWSLGKWLFPPSVPGDEVDIPDWIEVDLLRKNPYSRPGTPLEEISGVVIHYVGNPNTSAANNRDFFQNLAKTHETYASSHFIVGLDGEILQCVPLSEISYCSNIRNRDTIAVEICHPDDTGAFTPETTAAVQELTAWLCHTFDLTTENVIRHYDVTGKICPKYHVEHPEAWTDLLAGVQTRLESYAD